MSIVKIENWISRLKVLDFAEHERRAVRGRPLIKKDCEICKLISDMLDATVDVEFSS